MIEQDEVRVDALRDVVIDLDLELGRRRGSSDMARDVTCESRSSTATPATLEAKASQSGGHHTGQPENKGDRSGCRLESQFAPNRSFPRRRDPGFSVAPNVLMESCNQTPPRTFQGIAKSVGWY